MNYVFRLVNPVLDRNLFIFTVTVFIKRAEYEYNTVFHSSLMYSRRGQKQFWHAYAQRTHYGSKNRPTRSRGDPHRGDFHTGLTQDSDNGSSNTNNIISIPPPDDRLPHAPASPSSNTPSVLSCVCFEYAMEVLIKKRVRLTKGTPKKSEPVY